MKNIFSKEITDEVIERFRDKKKQRSIWNRLFGK